MLHLQSKNFSSVQLKHLDKTRKVLFHRKNSLHYRNTHCNNKLLSLEPCYLFMFKTDKVALNNFVEWNDETEWLYLLCTLLVIGS